MFLSTSSNVGIYLKWQDNHIKKEDTVLLGISFDSSFTGLQ